MKRNPFLAISVAFLTACLLGWQDSAADAGHFSTPCPFVKTRCVADHYPDPKNDPIIHTANLNATIPHLYTHTLGPGVYGSNRRHVQGRGGTGSLRLSQRRPAPGHPGRHRPIPPTIAGQSPPLAGFESLAVAKDYAYIAAGESGLRVMDISDPTLIHPPCLDAGIQWLPPARPTH